VQSADAAGVISRPAFDTYPMSFALGESQVHLYALGVRSRFLRSTGAERMVQFSAV
jgi:hypothetical protein